MLSVEDIPVSSVGRISGVPGATGPVVSIWKAWLPGDPINPAPFRAATQKVDDPVGCTGRVTLVCVPGSYRVGVESVVDQYIR
jgi:hypothetical protein